MKNVRSQVLSDRPNLAQIHPDINTRKMVEEKGHFEHLTMFLEDNIGQRRESEMPDFEETQVKSSLNTMQVVPYVDQAEPQMDGKLFL